MITVRTREDRDDDVLQNMVASMIGGSDVRAVAAREVQKYRTHPDYEVYVAETQGQIAGFGVIRRNPLEGSDGVAELGLFQIDEALRGRGIGTELLAGIEGRLKAGGTRKLYTTTNLRNTRAVRFWIGRGFEFEARLNGLNRDTDYYLLSKPLQD